MTGPSLDESDPYTRWNMVLLDWFFSPSSAGDEVWLQVSPELLDVRASHLGGDRGFCEAVRAGPVWTNARLTCSDVGAFSDAALRLMEQRQRRSTRPRGYVDPSQLSPTYVASMCVSPAPTYLPYLAALARTAAVNEQDGFYAALRNSLSLPTAWGTQQMARLKPVWEDLESWTRDCKGHFGTFRVRVLGGYSQIGYAKAQVIFSRRDIGNVGSVFKGAGLRRGQRLDGGTLEAIRTEVSHAHYLSAALREAIRKQGEYDDVIDDRLRVLFEEWDGKDPRLGAYRNSTAPGDEPQEEAAELQLCLTYDEEATEPEWRLHWQLPNYGDTLEIRKSGGAVVWRATPFDSSTAVTIGDTDPGTQKLIFDCLQEAEARDVAFTLSWAGDDPGQRLQKTLMLRQLQLRIFTPRHNPALGRDELGEHLLRSSGPAYLLASPSNAKRLREYLDREKLAHEYPPSRGLPEGWEVACLFDCGKLTAEKLSSLPNGEADPVAARDLRLMGGRFVTRSGVRQYLSYDLPYIEVDSRAAIIECAPDGLNVVEDTSSTPTTDTGLFAKHGFGPRKFDLELGGTSVRVFQISALLDSGETEIVRLRIASDSGEHVTTSEQFALDRLGAPARGAVGLRGIVSGDSIELTSNSTFVVATARLGERLDLDLAHDHLNTAAVEFLDSLAQCSTGSLAYPVARDQLRRLFARHRVEKTPGVELLNLRARGFLEIETNYKGHLVRIHAVKPTLYQLTLSSEGLSAYSVLGTLRKGNWQAIFELATIHPIYVDKSNGENLACFRILLGSPDTALDVAARLGFEQSGPPSRQVADWSADYQAIYGALAEGAVETLGSGNRSQELLNVNKLRFGATPTLDVPVQLSCQLYRLDDLETRQHKISVLGIRQNGHSLRWAFVRDSRWGIWIALEGFARFLAKNYNRPDVSPWPLPYCREDGSVWVPARAGLPVILERALTLCGGSGPRVVSAGVPMTRPDGELQLTHSLPNLAKPVLSPVYSDMAEGLWLVYRWVPLDIIEHVAEKLNAAVSLS